MRVGISAFLLLALSGVAGLVRAQDPADRGDELQPADSAVQAALARELSRRNESLLDQVSPPLNVQAAMLPSATVATGNASTTSNRSFHTVDLAGLKGRLGSDADFRLSDRANRLTEIDDQQSRVALEPGRYLAIAPEDDEPLTVRVGSRTVTTSSTRLITVDDSGRPRELSLFHFSDGLNWRPERSRFVGSLYVGIVDRADPSSNASDAGISVPVQLVADASALEPETVHVRRIGSPFEKVGIEVDFPADPYSVTLISNLDRNLPRARLSVDRPRVSLVAPPGLKGLGLGAGDVVVQGLNTSLRPGESITLMLDRGWLADNPVIVGDNGIATTRLRSDWFGRAQLSLAPSPIYLAESVELEYRFPVRFLVFSAIGAMLGALVYIYRLRRSAERTSKRLLFDWLVGALVGFVAPLMAYVGMKLPHWLPMPEALTGEIVPFVLAFFAAALGTALIDRVGGPRPATE